MPRLCIVCGQDSVILLDKLAGLCTPSTVLVRIFNAVLVYTRSLNRQCTVYSTVFTSILKKWRLGLCSVSTGPTITTTLI